MEKRGERRSEIRRRDDDERGKEKERKRKKRGSKIWLSLCLACYSFHSFSSSSCFFSQCSCHAMLLQTAPVSRPLFLSPSCLSHAHCKLHTFPRMHTHMHTHTESVYVCRWVLRNHCRAFDFVPASAYQTMFTGEILNRLVAVHVAAVASPAYLLPLLLPLLLSWTWRSVCLAITGGAAAAAAVVARTTRLMLGIRCARCMHAASPASPNPIQSSLFL